ncbi:TPA: hypothetical protein DIV55_05600 [Patescibacteria group bacterium]|nr:hypothetical protein [Patescibacteria group bacterium]
MHDFGEFPDSIHTGKIREERIMREKLFTQPQQIKADCIPGRIQVNEYIYPDGIISIIRVPGTSQPLQFESDFKGYTTPVTNCPGLAQATLDSLNHK